MFRYIVLCLGVLVIYGCAAKVNTSVLIPARESQILKYKTVAVFPFSYASQFESAIASANVDGVKLYTLVDRQQMKDIMNEQHFQMTLADPDSIVAQGKLLGIEGLWMGVTTNEYQESIYYESRTKCDKDGKNCYDYKVPCTKKVLNFTAMPRLISIATSGVVYSKVLTSMVSANVCSDSGYNITESELQSRAIQNVLRDFAKDIAPYRVNVTLEFMSKDKDIADDASKKLLKDGIAFVKEDRLERACESWKDALANNPKSVSLNYNTATCYEVKGDYKKAIEILTFTEKNMPPGSDGVTIKTALDRNIKNLDNASKTQQQMNR